MRKIKKYQIRFGNFVWKSSGRHIDFCHDISYNIITVKKNLMSKAGKEPERRTYDRYGNDR